MQRQLLLHAHLVRLDQHARTYVRVAARDFIERPEQFRSVLRTQISSRARPERALSGKCISLLAKGKYWGRWIEAPEFFDQLYPVGTGESQPNQNKIRFVTQE